jgi:hypothetical protein
VSLTLQQRAELAAKAKRAGPEPRLVTSAYRHVAVIVVRCERLGAITDQVLRNAVPRRDGVISHLLDVLGRGQNPNRRSPQPG